MKTKIVCVLLIFTINQTIAQNGGMRTENPRYAEFLTLFNAPDTNATKQFLLKWKKELPNDPERFIATFNYYFKMSRQEVIEISPDQNGVLLLNDDKGQPKGSLVSGIYFRDNYKDSAISIIDSGILLFPDRLDMRFGKTYVLKQYEHYEDFVKSIKNYVDLSLVNKNKWKWTNGKVLEDSEEFFISTIHNYLLEIYNQNDDSILKYAIEIGKYTFEKYPTKTVEISTLTGVCYTILAQYKEAILILEKTYAIFPKDAYVVFNLAEAYSKKGDKVNAKKYYSMIKNLDTTQELKDHVAEILKSYK